MVIILKTVISKFHLFIRRITYFLLGIFLALFLAHPSQASSGVNDANNALSTETILALAIGGVISVLYIRGMYLVLSYASKTYDLEEDTNEAEGYKSSFANKILLFGSFLLVVVSAWIIASYGFNWIFLYIGPILCLLGPLVVIFSMEVDLKKYKKVLASKSARQLEQERQQKTRFLDPTP